MAKELIHRSAQWIWTDQPLPRHNRYVAFRRIIDASSEAQAASIALTADARYELYVNGVWVGHGPARSWPSPWPVDQYDLKHLWRQGQNVIAMLVHHPGVSTFQYLHAEAGLLADVAWTDRSGTHRVVSDASWRALPHRAYASPVPRMAVQQTWEEQFDARMDLRDSVQRHWHDPAFDHTDWPIASVKHRAGKGPHDKFESTGLAPLQRQPVQVHRVMAPEVVKRVGMTYRFELRHLINPQDTSANALAQFAYVQTFIHSDRAQDLTVFAPQFGPAKWKLNGEHVDMSFADGMGGPDARATMRLHKGVNTLLCRLEDVNRGWMSVVLEPERKIALSRSSQSVVNAPTPWLFAGPFIPPTEGEETDVGGPLEPFHSEGQQPAPGASYEQYQAIWQAGSIDPKQPNQPWLMEVPAEVMSDTDVAARCRADQVDGKTRLRVDDPDAMAHDTPQWTVVHPPKQGDVRFTLDFGKERVGYTEIELDAPAGTIVDFYGFEFIQRDHLHNLPLGMNNTFRYTCRQGVQQFRTFLRRGYQYAYLVLRDFSQPVRIGQVRTLHSTYPFDHTGRFACSSSLLTRMWQVGAHTVQCCAEDTYTDCPTYEQTHWVGDARNEALFDLMINRDARLSAHCWLQAARSLDRSPIVESHVPSGWQIVLPAWTFLWMRWAYEHYMSTGDRAFARAALPWLDRNFQGIKQHINDRNLFEIAAWNMFDWAPMDTPRHGIVTHQNCLAVLGLRETAELARLMSSTARAKQWDALADKIADAVNAELWSERQRAYVDCIHAHGKPSATFSQQTQVAALIGQVAQGERAQRCQQILDKPPKKFVRAGSPFFMCFLLEAYSRQGRFDDLLKQVRQYWSPQIEAGATTFWEMYHPTKRRHTRSHCHGWSAAPVYYLSRYVLGVGPLEPGYAKVDLSPHVGDLRWAQGSVPLASASPGDQVTTPNNGKIDVHWRRHRSGAFWLEARLPDDRPIRLTLPVQGEVDVHQGKAVKSRRKNQDHFDAQGPVLELTVTPG